MPNLTASIPHRLTRAEAKQRIQDQIAMLGQQLGGSLVNVEATWAGDKMDFTARATGQAVAGHLIVDDEMVHVNLVLPWLLSLVANSFKKRIEQDVRRLLSAPARALNEQKAR